MSNPGSDNDLLFVPKGAASLSVDHDGPPRDFYFLLLPLTTMLAFSAAVEPLRIANQVSRKPLYRWFTATSDGAPVRCSNRVLITPDMALQDVPGKAFVFVCGGGQPQAAPPSGVIDMLRRHKAHGGGLGGICTGAFALARAGALRDRRFTLHWENQPGFAELFPDRIPSPARFEEDRGLLTCGGGHAATDMMLQVIEQDFGRELAVVVADMCIHSRDAQSADRQTSGKAAILGSRNRPLMRAVAFMQDHLEDACSMTDVADQSGTSKRQLERLFRRHTGKSPMQFYTDLRLKRAHALINETDLSVQEVAAATGFSPAIFTRRFREAFGVSPHHYRMGWTAAVTTHDSRSDGTR